MNPQVPSGPVVEPAVDDTEVISDAMMRRILVSLAAVVALAAAATGFVSLAQWATRADDVVEPLGSVDIGFMQDMIDHHEQALLIANTLLDVNPRGGAAPYAQEVVMFQELEITRMDGWLTDAGIARGRADRTAMQWMGMGTPVADMPGMQAPGRISELADARGDEADRLFFEIMSDHHLGGAHMADAAATGARRDEVRSFAEKMSYNQRIEVVEYERAVERLGL